MFEIEMQEYRDCDGVTRRDFIKVGALSAFGISMPGLFASQAAAHPSSKTQNPKSTSCILLWMGGGPSQIDTFDPKPDTPSEIRGEFGVIKTNVPGTYISDKLPHLAKHMDKLSIIRSVTSPDGNHETASHYLLTGYPHTPAVQYPAFGSVIARENGFGSGMPPYVMFGGLAFGYGGAGYMGAVYNPFGISGDPNNDGFSVADISPPAGVDAIRLERRRVLRDALDNWQRGKEASARGLKSVDEFYARAYSLVTSPSAKQAFNLKDEPAKVREEYGRNRFGQSCLLARRLVEAGVRCVTINMGGWDTHTDNFNALKNGLLPPLDKGYAALLNDLHRRGMLDTTLVVWMGEFGRTPRVNSAAGRDHWPGAISVCMGGGGVKTGMVIGSTNERSEMPKDRPLRVEDVAATIYHAMGIDTEKEYLSPQDRPLKINYDGQPIKELL